MAQFRASVPETGDVEHFESQNLQTAIGDALLSMKDSSEWRKSYRTTVELRSRDTATITVTTSSKQHVFTMKIGRISSSRRVAA